MLAQKLHIKIVRRRGERVGAAYRFDLDFICPLTGETVTRSHSATSASTAAKRAPAQVVERMLRRTLDVQADIDRLNAWLSDGFTAVIEMPDGAVITTQRPSGVITPEGRWTGDPLSRLPWNKR